MTKTAHHIQVRLAGSVATAVVERKRLYHQVSFPDYGMCVKVAFTVCYRGMCVDRMPNLAALHAVEYLESLPNQKILPVLQAALWNGTTAQAWALRRLGIEVPSQAHRYGKPVMKAREMVGAVVPPERS